jgi:hypothetical protein
VKLYLQGHCGHRIYLTSPATTRSEIPAWFQLQCPQDQSFYLYSSRSVVAQPESGHTAGGAFLGGIVGLLGGPIGLILGGAAGAMLGAANENTEVAKANRFNQS